MSGHSKWSTIKRQKAVTDAKRGAVFTRLGNMIAIAARAGTDSSTNAALALAIDKAKQANMPLANIERAIQRVSDKSAAQLQEILYEGYGPGGVAILVECATDNVNRTYPEVKNAFNKKGGSIAEKGAVAYLFERKGSITVKGSGEEILLLALDAGAEDVREEGDEMVVITDAKELAKVRNALIASNVDILDAELSYEPTTTVELEGEKQEKALALLDMLDELQDVTNTYTNMA